MNLGAGNVIHGFEINMFWIILNRYFINTPETACRCEHKLLQNNVNDIFPECLYVKDYENVELENW